MIFLCHLIHKQSKCDFIVEVFMISKNRLTAMHIALRTIHNILSALVGVHANEKPITFPQILVPIHIIKNTPDTHLNYIKTISNMAYI